MFITEESLKLVKEIANLLVTRRETVAVSESCCGGLIASCLVAIPGASRYFLGGTTTYSVKSRLYLSGWSEADISNYTGPSEEVVVRLARNLKMELGANYTLAETGWAGPDDGSHSGTAFLAVCSSHGNQSTQISTNSNDRVRNMETFAIEGLKYLLKIIQDSH